MRRRGRYFPNLVLSGTAATRAQTLFDQLITEIEAFKPLGWFGNQSWVLIDQPSGPSAPDRVYSTLGDTQLVPLGDIRGFHQITLDGSGSIFVSSHQAYIPGLGGVGTVTQELNFNNSGSWTVGTTGNHTAWILVNEAEVAVMVRRTRSAWLGFGTAIRELPRNKFIPDTEYNFVRFASADAAFTGGNVVIPIDGGTINGDVVGMDVWLWNFDDGAGGLPSATVQRLKVVATGTDSITLPIVEDVFSGAIIGLDPSPGYVAFALPIQSPSSTPISEARFCQPPTPLFDGFAYLQQGGPGASDTQGTPFEAVVRPVYAVYRASVGGYPINEQHVRARFQHVHFVKSSGTDGQGHVRVNRDDRDTRTTFPTLNFALGPVVLP
jgi:hypothetical protein